MMLRIRTSMYKTTEEMTKEEFQEFRVGWHLHTVRCMMWDGVAKEDAIRTAKAEFLKLKEENFATLNAITLKKRALFRQQKEEKRHVESGDDLSRTDNRCSPSVEGGSVRRWSGS